MVLLCYQMNNDIADNKRSDQMKNVQHDTQKLDFFGCEDLL